MEAKKCEIHDDILKPADVPIHYGLLSIDDKFVEARERLFPNANSFVMGGCVFQDENEMELLICEKCREAENDWQEEN